MWDLKKKSVSYCKIELKKKKKKKKKKKTKNKQKLSISLQSGPLEIPNFSIQDLPLVSNLTTVLYLSDIFKKKNLRACYQGGIDAKGIKKTIWIVFKFADYYFSS